MPKQADAKRDGEISPKNYNLNQFRTRKILMPSKRYESTGVDRRTWLHVPSGTPWSTSSDTHQEVEIKNETSTQMYTPLQISLIVSPSSVELGQYDSGITILSWKLYNYVFVLHHTHQVDLLYPYAHMVHIVNEIRFKIVFTA